VDEDESVLFTCHSVSVSVCTTRHVGWGGAGEGKGVREIGREKRYWEREKIQTKSDKHRIEKGEGERELGACEVGRFVQEADTGFETAT
jgi:hypothetical protein